MHAFLHEERYSKCANAHAALTCMQPAIYMLLLPLPLLALTTITTATTYYLLPQLPLSRRVLSRVGGPGFLRRLLLPLPLQALTTITTATTYYLLPQSPLSRRVLSRLWKDSLRSSSPSLGTPKVSEVSLRANRNMFAYAMF